MADFLSMLLSGLPSIISNFRGSATPYLPQQEALAKQQQQISQAQLDPNNPIYQNLYNRYSQNNTADLAQVIAEAQRQNRGAVQNGRTPLFSPERGGETLFRSLMQGYQDTDKRSDEQTRSALQGAQGGTSAALAGYNAVSPFGALNNYQKDILGPQGITNLLTGRNQQQAAHPNFQQQQPVYVLPQSSLNRGFYQ